MRRGSGRHKTLTGTREDDFVGIPSTGKRVTLQFVDIVRSREGRIVVHWLSMYQLSFMQVGVIPTSQTLDRDVDRPLAHDTAARSNRPDQVSTI